MSAGMRAMLWMQSHGLQNLEYTHGGMALAAWSQARRVGIIDGTFHAAMAPESNERMILLFPEAGGIFRIPAGGIRSVVRRGKLINTAVEIEFVDDQGIDQIITLLGPNARMNSLMAAVGQTL